MIEYKLTTNKGDKIIQIPVCWAECPVRKFSAIVTEWDKESTVQLFSILSGIPVKAVSESHDHALEEQLIFATRFVYEEPMNFKDAEVPKYIELGSKTVKIPEGVKELTIGQNVNVRQALDSATYYEELVSFVVAIYLQPFYDSEDGESKVDYDYTSALRLKELVDNMPIVKVYSLFFSLLSPLMKRGNSMKRGLIQNLTT